jgi:predicted flap endonuclease-1-like 5' DNA nuclease
MIRELFFLVEVNKLIDVEGIGPVHAEKLKSAGAETTKDLLKLAKTPKAQKKLAKATGIAETLILKWANHADLMRIKGIGGEYAELLEKVGVDTVKELAKRNADNLHEAVEKFDLMLRLLLLLCSQHQCASSPMLCCPSQSA